MQTSQALFETNDLFDNLNNGEIDIDLVNFDDEEKIEVNGKTSINDGLVLSLRNKGRVDIHYISEISGAECSDVVKTLRGAIYQNPMKCSDSPYEGFEESSEYLSGNLYKKLQEAKEMSKKSKLDFSTNIKAIEALIKTTTSGLTEDDIYVTLGTPWIPEDYIRDFIRNLIDNSNYTKCFKVVKDAYTGVWEFKNKYVFNYSFNNSSKKYGTPDINAVDIILKTLNNQNVTCFDTIIDYKHTSRVLNKDATMLALQKQKHIIELFQSWIWVDPKRREKLKEIYANNYACIRKRIYNGSFLDIPGMNKDIHLYDYQKNAIARIIFTPNTLLAHKVGSGKTYIMIAAGMELRRLGISKKNCYVVPNNIVGEWKNDFLTLFPNANILVIDPASFKKDKRAQVMRDFKHNDYDGIIIAYSCFELIKMSLNVELEELKKKLKEVEEQSKKESTNSLRNEWRKLKRHIDKLEADAEEQLRSNNSLEEKNIYFEELGITRIFLDEAHNYKNVPIDSQVSYVLGINTVGSKKGQDMMEKVKYTQVNNHGGVIMATGTPITNSICDVYIFQKYLEEGELRLLDIDKFDEWLQMFAERTSEFEIDVDTNSYRLATRYSKFHNIPELTSVLSIVSDFYYVDNSDLPSFDGYQDVVVKKSEALMKFLGEISERADAVRRRQVDNKDDNLLKITTDGRKAALDLRIFSNKYSYQSESKAQKCADEVSKIYFQTMDSLSTQLIFSDISTPKAGFNIYDELKRLLVLNGVSVDEIAYIHDATSEKQRTDLFNKVRKGKIRILLGSTQKLGTGVNVQERLVAIHHLDIPWRSSDIMQREGRMVRQGNSNDNVYIYRYITEGSFDAYSWQLLEYKQKMIDELLSGTMYDSSISDVSDAVLSYAEVKALAIGNPLLKKRFEVQNELTRTILLHKKELEKSANLKQEEIEDKDYSKRLRLEINNLEKDIEVYHKNKVDYSIKANSDRRIDIRNRIIKKYNEYLNDTTGQYNSDKNVFLYQGMYITFPGKLTTESLNFAIADESNQDDNDSNGEVKDINKNKFIYIKNFGTYKVILGDRELGYLIRIDNVLEGLEKRLKKSKDELSRLNKRVKSLKGEYDNILDYTEEIERLKIKLKQIDNELGVKEK